MINFIKKLKNKFLNLFKKKNHKKKKMTKISIQSFNF